MVEPVATLLVGRGHRVTRVRDAGLANDADPVIAEYAIAKGLVVVTFDADFRNGAMRRGARCLYIRPPERSSVERLKTHYEAVMALLLAGSQLVTLPRKGEPKG
jgi:predicted nuclease of predicted toxin-antitoxin system